MQGAGGIGGLLAVVDSGETYHYLYDANGNIGQLIKASDGSIAAHYEYDPFSNIISKFGSYVDDNPFRFSSKYLDVETYPHHRPGITRVIYTLKPVKVYCYSG